MKRKKVQVCSYNKEKIGQCVTAMVCHCSRLASDPSVPPEKKCMSSGRSRPCARLRATRPPSPCAQVLTLAVIGRGSLPSLKVVCQPISGCEEDSTLDLTRAIGQASLVGSRIVIPSGARGGGVLEGASSVTLGSCSVVRYLFWPGGGGVGLLP